MPAVRERFTQQDWSDGMARDVAPTLISEAGAYDIVNGLLDEDGNPYRRGGTEYKTKVSEVAAVLDDFNRPDENPVSQGGNWVGRIYSDDGDLAVASNELASTGPSLSNLSAVYATAVADGEVFGTYTGGAYVYLYIRTAGEGEASLAATLRGYRAYFTAKGSVGLQRYDVGLVKPATLETSSGVPLAVGDQIKLVALGAQIAAWHRPEGGEWVRVVSATDSAYASGKVAVALGASGGSLDDFGGTKPTAGFSEDGLTWLWDGYLLPGRRSLFASAADFGVFASDDETPINLGGSGLALPKQSAVLEDLLFIGGGTIYGGSRKSANYSTGTVKVTNGSKTVTGAGTAFMANVDAGMLFQIGNERVYVVSSVDSDTQLTLRDNYQGATGEGKAYALRPLYSISAADPYEASDFYTVCSNRLVFGSGRTIKFTEVNNPHSVTNHLGTTNEHKLPAGVWLLGLATSGDVVLPFTTGGAWVLDGLALDIVDINGNAQHRLERLSGEVVLAGAPGIAGYEQRLVVPAADGIYLMDGVSAPERISKPIDRLYGKRIADGYPLGKAVLYRGHYFLPILDVVGNVRDLFVCRLDRPTRMRRQRGFPWSRFTGDGGEIAAFAVRASAETIQPKLLGAQARSTSRIVDCTHYFEPDEAHAADADGTPHIFDLIGRDMATGGETENVVRGTQIRYEMVEAPGGEPVMRVMWSDGSLDGGQAEWDEFDWDAFDWVATGAVFHAIDRKGPPSDGRRPENFRINQRMRYARIRVMTEGPAASFALRALALNVRPSGAVRR
jgi:hypothetical protein